MSLSTNRNLLAALSYAARGWRVFPCFPWIPDKGCACGKKHDDGRQGKHPRVRGGFKSASTDPERVKEWWAEHQDSNIGVATGEGIFVLDIDPDNGGDESLAALEKKYGQLPPTVECITGGGGRHLWFKVSSKVPISVGGAKKGTKYRDGIDVRCDGGYVVVPPSMHASGRRYEWEACGAPDDVEMALAPDWLIAMARHELEDNEAPERPAETTTAGAEPGAAQPSPEGSSRLVIPKGTRNDKLFRMAAAARGKGKSEGEILVELRGYNARNCNPPLDDDEVVKIAHSAAGYDANRLQLLPGGKGPPRPAQAPPRGPQGGGGAAPAFAPDLSGGEAPAGGDWFGHLTQTRNGVKASLNNAMTMLRHEPELQGLFRYNSFVNRPEFSREPPWGVDYAGKRPVGAKMAVMSDTDINRIIIWLERKWKIEFSGQQIESALDIVSREDEYHPIRDYIENVAAPAYDANPGSRLATWLETYAGARTTPANRLFGRWWLISAIARVFKPGERIEGTLILEGRQGKGKSSLFGALGGEWFSDELPNLADKDAKLLLAGVWILELAELDAMQRSELSAIKKFLLQGVDRYRPPYGRRVVAVERQTVFGGSVNDHEYLRDPTGGRRFMPVAVGDIRLDELIRDRDLLWGEAYRAWYAGEKWYPLVPEEREVASEEQEKRYVPDPWEEQLMNYLGPFSLAKEPVFVANVLEKGIGLRPDRCDRSHRTRAGQVLSRIGWHKGERTRVGAEVLVTPWWPPQTPEVLYATPEGTPLVKQAFERVFGPKHQAPDHG